MLKRALHVAILQVLFWFYFDSTRARGSSKERYTYYSTHTVDDINPALYTISPNRFLGCRINIISRMTPKVNLRLLGKIGQASADA